MAEPSADQRAAARTEIRRVLDRIASLDDAAAEASLRGLEGLRQAVADELDVASGWNAARLGRMRQGIERMTGDYARRFGRDLAPFLEKGWELGQDLADAPLKALGFHVGHFALPGTVFEAATAYNLVLVKGLAQDAARAVQREVMLGATGVKSPQDVMAAIGESLDSPGVFRTIADRAEAIARTEVNRLTGLASQARKEEAAREVPGLKKQWVHGPVRKLSRPNHYAEHPGGVNRQIRDVDQPFEVPGSGRAPAEEAMFPLDPSLSAANSVNCKCKSIPYREDWGIGARHEA